MNRSPLIVALLLLILGAISRPALADQQDVAATVRGVVRVVIIATNGQDAYFVGHGSGFAVAPDKVLTNAHVVELLRTEKNLVVGIIPSQGKRSYGGKVIAYSPGNDLALIQLTEGTLPVATFFSGAVTDGQQVTAIGYPAAVDRAQGLDLQEMVEPLSPVKTSGTVSTGRASHGFDTILHTAPMAQGNSGGPLVDDCGRVLGVNSFGSEAENKADAEFGFAVSNREVASFLRQAGVRFQRTATPCRSIADLDAQEAQRHQDELLKQQQREQAEATARERARDQAEHEIYTARENRIAVAALLLVLSGLSLVGAMMYHVQGKQKERLRAAVAGALLLLGSVSVFLLRPSFSDIEKGLPTAPGDGQEDGIAKDYPADGQNICHIDESRSRITVTNTTDVPVNWQADGCVNEATQYGKDAQGWSRIFVPHTEAVVSINSFDPGTGTYKVERFLPDADIMTKARDLRSRFTFNGCTTDKATLSKLEQMQSEIRAVLPAQPNERLVYQCQNGDSSK